MDKLNEIKKLLPTNIEENLVISAIFDMIRKYDSLFVKELKKIKKEKGVTIDSIERNNLRKAYYYSLPNKYNIKFEYNNEQLSLALDDFTERLKNYDSNLIISSLIKRIDDVGSNRIKNNTTEWLDYYNKKRQKSSYSLIILKIDQKLFSRLNFNLDRLTSFIVNTYSDLENYRYLIIVFDGIIQNKDKDDVTWKLIYKLSIFAENFVQFKRNFFAFHKEKQIKRLELFLDERDISNSKSLASQFYENISCGFKFEDCYLSSDLNKKILVFKKIELDENNVPCPSCMSTIQSGNSYPEMFLRSWECKNPNCPDRSKSGRGKRFDEYGTYRYFKLSENNKNNIISNEMYKDWHRDIFDKDLDYVSYLIKAYSWNNEHVYFVNFDEVNQSFERNITINKDLEKFDISGIKFNELPIYKLFKNLFEQIRLLKLNGSKKLINELEIINDNSASYLTKLLPNQIGGAITSPPYYNAREYSKWGNLIMYLIDMMINANSVYYSLCNDAYYLYNIGDIVSEDNIYIKSNMSRRRIQLGFLSCLIFEIIGYDLSGNIIWDKGEVQSKRNSTINLFSGYLKPVNCYEHMFIFKKGQRKTEQSKIIKISPVIKINSKGENKYKHSAPYPIDLVEEIRNYAIKDKYILDPYLGSGTTLVWCKKNKYKGLGIELNCEYYNLCKENIYNKYR